MELHKFEISDSRLEHNNWHFPKTLKTRPLQDTEGEDFLTHHKIDKSYDDSTVRFKLLCGNALNANLRDTNDLPLNSDVVNSIKQQGWISEEYQHLWRRDEGGSAALTSRGILTFILQTPRDGKSFCSLSLVSRERYYSGGLFIADERYNLNALLASQRYLNKHPKVPRDFAVLPFQILVSHVDETLAQVQEISRHTTSAEKRIADGSVSLDDNGDYKLLNRLNLEHVRLQRRSEFELELGTNLLKYMDSYLQLWPGLWSSNTSYVDEMREKIEQQMRYSEQIQKDLKMMPRRLDNLSKALFNIVMIRDNKLNISLAESSKRIAEESRVDNLLNAQLAKATADVAEQTRQDGAAMKTIAVLTLTFLPGTAVASFFSMNGMFNWTPSEGQPLVSPYLYVFFVTAIPLTGIVYAGWWWWFRRMQKQFEQQYEESDFVAVNQNLMKRMRTATNSWHANGQSSTE